MGTWRRLLVCGALVAAIGCIHLPQTRPEFLVAARTAASTQVIGATSNRHFDYVARDLNAFTAACLNVDVRSHAPMSSSAYSYVGTFVMTQPGHAELTVQMQGGVVGAPPGGQYIFALDLDATGPTTASAAIYGPVNGWDEVFANVVSVVEGRATYCPDLP